MRPSKVVAVVTVAAMAAAWGCSRTDERLGSEIGAPPAQFGGMDAGPDAEPDPRELIAYCPSNKCPPGWTTCPGSRFPCDVNLRVDPNNCGACGNACPTTSAGIFSCVEGTCGMTCPTSLFDCDGLVDNGCETSASNDLNCGACGNACPADKPCLLQDPSKPDVGCGCPPGKVNCAGCRDMTADDQHCGACDNQCDPTGGPGAPQYPNMVYGCSQSECGHARCKPYFQDCDSEKENGCETSIVTDDNCGGCGNVCPAGQHCYLNPENNEMPECLCAGDLTPCLRPYEGHSEAQCVDLKSDAKNCGACGVVCEAAASPWMRRDCDYGTCVSRCEENHADCNGNEADGCEIDTRSDPRNCGGCGIVCDAVAGQACVAGKCVVERCDQLDAGEATR